jgi:hypothetical protein
MFIDVPSLDAARQLGVRELTRGLARQKRSVSPKRHMHCNSQVAANRTVGTAAKNHDFGVAHCAFQS